MKDSRGFTLLELLIAAAIIGVLVLFATQSFRQTASDVRVQDALARAKVIAMAARRFYIDHPNAAEPSGDEMGLVSLNNPDNFQCTNTLTLETLIGCGYLDYRQYGADMLRSEEGNNVKFKRNFKMWFSGSGDGVQVCFQGRTKKIMMDEREYYCTDGELPYKHTN